MSTRITTHSAVALLRPAVWSNIVFLFPFALAVFFGNLIVSLLIASVFVASTLYHFTSEKEKGFFLTLDQTLGSFLALFNAGLVAFGAFTPPYFYFALVFVAFALYFYKRQYQLWFENNFSEYEIYHSLWHVASSLITVFSILTFYF